MNRCVGWVKQHVYMATTPLAQICSRWSPPQMPFFLFLFFQFHISCLSSSICPHSPFLFLFSSFIFLVCQVVFAPRTSFNDGQLLFCMFLFDQDHPPPPPELNRGLEKVYSHNSPAQCNQTSLEELLLLLYGLCPKEK